MAQAQPDWAVHEEGEKLVAALVKAQPQHLGHVDPTKVGCAITTKPKPESQTWDAQLQGVKEPISKWCEKAYCIVYYKSTWDAMTETQRQAMFFRLLERVHEDCSGKTLPYSLQDSYTLVKKFGADYMLNTKLPDLLTTALPMGEKGEE